VPIVLNRNAVAWVWRLYILVSIGVFSIVKAAIGELKRILKGDVYP